MSRIKLFKKNIILIYFQVKNTLKNNIFYNTKPVIDTIVLKS